MLTKSFCEEHESHKNPSESDVYAILQNGINPYHWSKTEHQAFMHAINLVGSDIALVALMVKTKSP